MKLDYGKLNISIGGQWGSEGKALLNNYLAYTNDIDISITNCSANAGHSFYIGNKKYIAKYLPVTGILNKRSTIYLSKGSIINTKILLEELNRFDINTDRVFIHPNAAIINDDDIENESYVNSSVTKIASTQSGGGAALARKIMRSAKLAKDVSELSIMIRTLDLQYYIENDCTLLMEVPQGLELSLNSKHYPYVTSRDINVQSAMNDADVHPSYLGKVCVCLRTLPIRVGNIYDNDEVIGHSGPVYDDMTELSWDDLNIPAELTTVTNRKRRIFSWSNNQYKYMLKTLRPDYILLNFANYLRYNDLIKLLKTLPEVTHLGFGPKVEDVYLNNYAL